MILNTQMEKRQAMHNAIANMINALHRIQNKPETWDVKIQVAQELGKLVPLIIRCLIYFKNTE